MTAPDTPTHSPRAPRVWFLNPLFHIFLNGIFTTASEILFKRGASSADVLAAPLWLRVLGFTALGSWWVWAGILCAIVAFLTWLHALRYIPLSIAFPLASLVHVLIPLGAWVFLGESISPGRWVGILFIVAGICIVSRPLIKAEDAL